VRLAPLLMLLALAMTGAAPAPAQSDDLVLNFCRSIGGTGKISCDTGPILRIPRKYLRHDQRSRDVLPSDRLGTQLALRFPGFIAWADAPPWERWLGSAHVIHIELDGLTSQTVRDLHAVDFLGDPKAVPAAPEFGLRHYQRTGWGVSDIYLPEGDNPALRIQCPVPTAGRETLCVVQTFTGYGLKLRYSYPRVLLPHWADIQSRVLSLFQSSQNSRSRSRGCAMPHLENDEEVVS
jgi:hypothetical protein